MNPHNQSEVRAGSQAKSVIEDATYGYEQVNAAFVPNNGGAGDKEQ
jgi:hypothetical protein